MPYAFNVLDVSLKELEPVVSSSIDFLVLIFFIMIILYKDLIESCSIHVRHSGKKMLF